jgi:hypothetical protein
MKLLIIILKKVFTASFSFNFALEYASTEASNNSRELYLNDTCLVVVCALEVNLSGKELQYFV